jgi:endoglucanase
VVLLATRPATPPADESPSPAASLAGVSPSPSTAPSASARATPPPLVGKPAQVRVDQVGYDIDLPAGRRAFLLSPVAAGRSNYYVVGADGSTAFTAPVPPTSLGAWNQAFGFVYPLDLSSIATPGGYRVSVSGAVSGISPAFRIDSAANLYGPLLPNALAFYQAQRDGPNVVPSVLRRQPAHFNDRAATTYLPPVHDADGMLVGTLRKAGGLPVDASGGWADAGDYVKFVQTTSYVVDIMLIGIRDEPGLLGPASAADFTDEARFGLDWLLRMWDDRSATLYYQVGIGDGNDTTLADHDVWRLPEADDTYGGDDPASRFIRHRPVFRAAPSGSAVSPNLAGRLAAAFAGCYTVFRITDPAYAERCLRAGEHVYDLADTKPKHLLSVSPYDFYPETQWRDDLELGAVELYRALAEVETGPAPPDLPHPDAESYLVQAAHWAHAYLTGPKDFDSLNLYDVAGLAHFELIRAIEQAGDPGGLEVDRAALLADMEARLDAAVTRASADPFGFGGDYASFDSAAHAFGLATMASEVDELTGASTYAGFGRDQLAVLLGSNAWGTSLLIGAGTTFPHCMQHQVANLAGSLDGTPPVLLGAVVNGPNAPQDDVSGTPDGARPCADPTFAAFDGDGGHYVDGVASWPTVEPALDYSVLQILAFTRAIEGLP